MLDWNVAIYCSNEAENLGACLLSVLEALEGQRAVVTVLVNGSSDRSLDVAKSIGSERTPVEIFEIRAADKSNAINQFFENLREKANGYAGVDGYARIARNSFYAMAERFSLHPNALAVTGIPETDAVGMIRNPKMFNAGGRLYGQLHAFRPEFIDRMVARRIKLPVGLYRGDGLLGSMAAHDLDPVKNSWDNCRICAAPLATFRTPLLLPWKVNDVRRVFRRRVRQMRGNIENAAIKSIIYSSGFRALPENADDMISAYLSKFGSPRATFPSSFFLARAIRQVRANSPLAPEDLVPRKVR